MNNSVMVQAIVRHAVGAAGGGLVTSGVVSGSDWELVAGAVATIAAVAWSIWEKRRAK